MDILKRYNKETGLWEEIESHSSVIVSGDPKYDTEIIVTNPNYSKEDGSDVKLYETLGEINTDISTMKGNIAWLAKHGGGGSGSGGGSSSTYSILVQSPTVTNNIINVSSSSLTVKFKITGGSQTDTCQYLVSYDGEYILGSSWKTLKCSAVATFTIDNINQYRTSDHQIIIEALNPYNIAITPLVISVVENSVKVSCDSSYTTNVNGSGSINVNVENKIANTQTTLVFKNQTYSSKEEYRYEYTSTSTSKQTIPINLFGNVIDKDSNLKVGKTYTIQVYAEVVSNATTITSDPVTFKVLIKGSNEIAILINGVTDAKPAIGELFTFSFISYLSNSSYLYYYVEINGKKDGEDDYKKLISGDYNNNIYTKTETEIVCIWTVPNNTKYVDYEWTVDIKCWNSTGQISGTTSESFNVIASSGNFFNTQIPKCSDGHEGTSLFASWTIRDDNYPLNTSTLWESINDNYSNTNSNSENITVPLNIYRTNGEISGFLTNPSRKIRFQNNAYGIIDFSEYKEKLSTDFVNGDYGFTLSVCFKSSTHSDKERTILLWGTNNSQGELVQGIRIDLETIYWSIIFGTEHVELTAKIHQNKLTNVDFVYNKEKQTATIYIDGVINASKEVSGFNSLANEIYLATNKINNNLTNICDVEFYNISLFSKTLNDIQIVVNAKNAKLPQTYTQDDIDEYSQWKINNLFYTDENNPTLPTSYLCSANGEYKTVQYSTIANTNAPMPVLLIDASSSDFSVDDFRSTTLTSSDIQKYGNVTFTYYDPTYNKSVDVDNCSVSIQGTSSLTYRNKNLELYINNDASGNYRYFQPCYDWFPENEFTLKADIVDSAHANNATIGRWVNNCGLFEDNPAMVAINSDTNDNNKPLDVYTNSEGKSITATTADYSTTDYTKALSNGNIIHNIKIKQTLEGFPIIVLMKFKGQTNNDTVFLGIYSFNLGRSSYFNMGFSFFKSFSRRNAETGVDEGCPALITNYEKYGQDESITYYDGGTTKTLNINQIYSFELNSDADQNDDRYPCWSQYDMSIIKHIGEFKFNGSVGDNSAPSDNNAIWTSLQNLFEAIATCGYETTKDYYTWDSTKKDYIDSGNQIQGDTQNTASYISQRLSINNAMAYFITASIFGLVDSLGKNMTLRTWGNGLWFNCFYDMDTANGLDNSSNENVSSDAYIDYFANDNPDYSMNTYYNYKNAPSSVNSSYGSYNSRLWNVLRNKELQYSFRSTEMYSGPLLYTLYFTIRNKNTTYGVFSSDNFVSLIETQMSKCGELLYNYDYTEKYITKYTTSTGTYSYGNIQMLHGNRIEYIRQWLKDRLIFLDGIFDTYQNTKSGVDETTITSTSFPYFKSGTLYIGGKNVTDKMVLTVRTSSPVIMRVETGQNGVINSYYIPAYTDTQLNLNAVTSTAKATSFNAIDIITKLDGLKYYNFQKYGDQMVLPSIGSIDFANCEGLEQPIDFSKTYLSGSTSNLQVINLSNIKAANSASFNFAIKLSGETYSYDRLTDIDISNSFISELTLSKAPLTTLKVNNSNIVGLDLQNQPFLTSINLSDLLRLTTLSLGSCDSLEKINVPVLPQLEDITILNCDKLSSLTITGAESSVSTSAIENIEISNCPLLESLTIDYCNNDNLVLRLSNLPNLKRLNITNCSKITNFTVDSLSVSGITSLNISGNIKLEGLIYSDSDLKDSVETITLTEDGVDNSYPVLNLYPFANLSSTNFSMAYDNAVCIIRLPLNNEFETKDAYFSNLPKLRRLIGTLILKGQNVFSGSKNFKIGEDLNIIISENATDLTGTFTNTACDENDMLKFLGNSGLTNTYVFDEMFSRCSNIKIDLTDYNDTMDEIFGNMTNATSIDSMFLNSKYVYTDTIEKNNIIKYLPNLTKFNSVFPNTLGIDNDFFKGADGQDLKIEEIKQFKINNRKRGTSLITIEIGGDNGLFRYLPKLKTINQVLNSTMDGEVKFNDKAFEKNPLLESISQAFNYLKISEDSSFNNLLDGLTSLKDIKYSFDNFEYLGDSVLKLGSNFFPSITENGKTVCNIETIEESFEINKECETVEELYKMFLYTSKIKSLNNFLSNLKITDLGSETYIHLPKYNGQCLFANCTELTDLSYCFQNLNTPYMLESEGFIYNNKLENVSGIFKGGTKIGFIPRKLFKTYEGDTGTNTITNMSYSLSNSSNKEITPYIVTDEDDDTYENSYYEDSNIVDENGNFKTALISGYIPDSSSINIESTDNLTIYLSENKNILTNYFVAPDIFDYCVNSSSTNIEGTFADSGYYKVDECDNWYELGFKGRIPPQLFANVSKITSISAMFRNCIMITPHKWGTVSNKKLTEYGSMYPLQLLSSLTYLRDMSNTFYGTFIWGGCNIDTTIPSSVQNLSGTWGYCIWPNGGDKVTYYLDKVNNQNVTDFTYFNGLFNSCSNITNISSMLIGHVNDLYGVINNILPIFTTSQNPNITYCSYFMSHCTLTKGTVPELWNFSLITRDNHTNAFSEMIESNISNYDDIPKYENWGTENS